jgi:hypothetical protein
VNQIVSGVDPITGGALVDANGQILPVSYTVPDGVLTTDNTYYWQVHARSTTYFGDWRSYDVSGAWLAANNFDTPPLPAMVNLPAPVTGAPDNAAIGLSTTPTLTWSAVTGATSYRVMVASTAAEITTDPASAYCPTCLVNDIASGGLTTSYTVPAGALAVNQTYWWSVKARSPDSYGAWSTPASSFSTTGTLSINMTGTGSGRVVSTPAGIDCHTGTTGTCAADFGTGAVITLTATADAGTSSAFGGWSGGGCVGRTDCTLNMNTAATVAAAFVPSYPETVPATVYQIHPDPNNAALTISTFSPTGSIPGNVELRDGTLDLNGQTLTIQGNLIQSGGLLFVNGGKLVVLGDYRIQSYTADAAGQITGYGAGTGYLLMVNALDSVVVNGQFVTQTSSGNTSGSLLTAGVLEVRGDFTQKVGTSSIGPYNFFASGTHKVLLSGAGLQTVSFENPGASIFNVLENANASSAGVVFATPFNATTYLSDGNKVSSVTVSAMNWTLAGNDIVGGDLQLAGGALDLNGHTLTINGNLIQSGGVLTVNGGRLIVNGDYRIQTKNPDGTYAMSAGYLLMVNAADTVLVTGQFVTQTSAVSPTGALLNAGVLEIKGDFTQKVGAGNYGPYDFAASGTHKVLLSGAGLQTVSFETPGASGFNLLDWTGDSSRIQFSTLYVVVINIVPNAPTGVSAAAGNSQAVVSFLAPAQNGGSPITSYKLTASPGNLSVNSTSSPVTFTGLTNGTPYTFTVTATNLAGTGVASAASAPVTPLAAPVLSYPSVLALGWNLMGNSLNQAMPVASIYADPAIITSVWKWDTTTAGWQFYTPQMTAPNLQTYAASKGYGVLSVINAGEGYWVNAKTASSLGTQSGPAFSLTLANLIKGWNLTATGNDVLPAALNLSLSATPPAVGTVPINLTTLWAWDNTLSQWYFYAPSLQANGSLGTYIAGKGYLDFTQHSKTLGNGLGFWVNMP